MRGQVTAQVDPQVPAWEAPVTIGATFVSKLSISRSSRLSFFLSFFITFLLTLWTIPVGLVRFRVRGSPAALALLPTKLRCATAYRASRAGKSMSLPVHFWTGTLPWRSTL